jgi:hypothetical protein
MIAISIMRRQGFTGELMNIYGGFGAIQKTDLEIVNAVTACATT